jgi:uncharacterized membrane protein YdbT with pleckstrin-like domain
MIGRHPHVLLPPTQERRVVQVRQHWAVLLEPMVKTVGVVIVAFLLSRLVSGVGEGLWLLQSWIEVITVTDKRLMRTSGVIQTKNSMIPITKVTDLTFERPFVGQLLGFGTLRVESAGQKPDLQKIKYVPRPEEVFKAISELIFGEKKQPRSHMLGPPRSSRRKRWAPLARRSDPEGR